MKGGDGRLKIDGVGCRTGWVRYRKEGESQSVIPIDNDGDVFLDHYHSTRC
jgi:hypothetical protein